MTPGFWHPTGLAEDEVTVGHLATMEGCVIERGALIGMGAVVLQRARVGTGVGCRGRERGRRGRADSPEVLAAGIPAQGKRELSRKAEQWGRTAAREYQRLAPRYLAEAPGRPADIGRVGIGRLAAICWRRA